MLIATDKVNRREKSTSFSIPSALWVVLYLNPFQNIFICWVVLKLSFNSKRCS